MSICRNLPFQMNVHENRKASKCLQQVGVRSLRSLWRSTRETGPMNPSAQRFRLSFRLFPRGRGPGTLEFPSVWTGQEGPARPPV